MQRRIFLAIDLATAAVLIVCAGVTVWMVGFRENRADVEFRDLTQQIDQMRRDISIIDGAIDANRLSIAQRRVEINALGKLPDRTPVERDLRTLVELASTRGVSVLRVTPLPSRAYPGLLEVRYSLETSATLANLMNFLKAVEDDPLWADVGYVRLERAKDDRAAREGDRMAVLTVSLFSSPTGSTG